MLEKLGQITSNLILGIGIVIVTLLLIPLIPVVDQWYQLVIVKSGSMEPWLPVGSVAIYQAKNDYDPGEIIAYHQGDGDEIKLIIHRLTKKQTQDHQTTYFTQGDATQYLSPKPIFAGQIKGKVIGVIPRLGFVLSWIKSKAGIAVLMLLSLILFASHGLRRGNED
jgi:signal peptidase I